MRLRKIIHIPNQFDELLLLFLSCWSLSRWKHLPRSCLSPISYSRRRPSEISNNIMESPSTIIRPNSNHRREANSQQDPTDKKAMRDYEKLNASKEKRSSLSYVHNIGWLMDDGDEVPAAAGQAVALGFCTLYSVLCTGTVTYSKPPSP